MHDPLAFIAGAAAQTGRVALVTGGASAAGAVVVQALAARGYAVAIHAHGSLPQARGLAERLEGAGVPSLAVTADFRDEGPVRAMVHRVADHFGRIDALVTCAVIRHAVPLEEVTADDLRIHFDVTCVGTFVAAQEAGAVMVRQPDGGGIVTVGDWEVARPRAGFAAAMPSLGALPAMTRSLAVEWAARNPRVRVNCVLAGVAAVPAEADAMASAARAAPLVSRSGTPEHLAHAVLFLLENDFVTGVCLPVDGGRMLA